MTPGAGAGTPRLRVLPVPVNEPNAVRSARAAAPRHPATQGTLALAFPATRPDVPERTDPTFGPRSTRSSDLPDPVATSSALVQAVVEVLGGSRPMAQLSRWLSTDVYTGLARRAGLAARLRRGTVPAARPAVVARVRVCQPRDGVAEASAVVVDAERVRAVAVRLEGLDGRWRATALEVG